VTDASPDAAPDLPGLPASDPDDRHAWERPGAFEVAPGVHRIPLPLPNDGLKAVNVYAISDGDQVVCIDGGWALAEAGPQLAAGLASIGYGLRDVREYLVTHLHRDHYTNAVAMRREYGGRVSLGEGERACLELIRLRGPNPDVERLLIAGAPALAQQLSEVVFGDANYVNWEDPDRWLPNGVDLPLATRTLRVISTPGHTVGHVVFHDPTNQVLFAGDHVLPHITPSIGVELNRPPSPLRDYLASLELVRAMPDARLLPAHGPATGSVHDRIDELLHHHAERLDATATAVAHGAHTAFEVASALPWTRRRHRLVDMDFFNQMLAVQETMAHLRVLAERDRLTESIVANVAHFTSA
jgi:glyoxylase-like metal-dependent hydrolase (beta-lactamase superfamily II)